MFHLFLFQESLSSEEEAKGFDNQENRGMEET